MRGVFGIFKVTNFAFCVTVLRFLKIGGKACDFCMLVVSLIAFLGIH
jgi:hypothetical protein